MRFIKWKNANWAGIRFSVEHGGRIINYYLNTRDYLRLHTFQRNGVGTSRIIARQVSERRHKVIMALFTAQVREARDYRREKKKIAAANASVAHLWEQFAAEDAARDARALEIYHLGAANAQSAIDYGASADVCDSYWLNAGETFAAKYPDATGGDLAALEKGFRETLVAGGVSKESYEHIWPSV